MSSVTTQDTLNIFFILAILVITSCVIYVSYYLVQALKSITNLSDDIDEIALNIKNKVAIKVLAAIPALLVSLVSKVIKKKRG